jgi:hypothetical protein
MRPRLKRGRVSDIGQRIPDASPWIVELRPEAVEALSDCLGGEFMLLVIADDHLALALPNGCLDLRELVLAAQGFDGLIEDGLNVLLIHEE